MRAFGITFLARPRSEKIEHAKETSYFARLGMAVLALLTLVLGLCAAPVSKILTETVSGLAVFARVSSYQVSISQSSVSVPAILFAIIMALVAVWIFVLSVSRKQKAKIGITWDCGTDLTPRMEITATGFSRSIITVFKNILQPRRELEMEYHDEQSGYFPKKSIINMELHDIYKTYFYGPFSYVFNDISNRVRKIQSGNINGYILYIFIALVALLYFAVK